MTEASSTAPSGALGRIGICLSGGGYRAAAFHLGTLDLFHRVGILRDVRAVSTVSGGTFVGSRWALAVARGEPFEVFFDSFWRFLDSTDCVDAALEELKRERPAAPSKRVSLITAAAAVYGRPNFLGDATLAELFDSQGSLEDVIFNTTEFHSGLDFRFQVSRRGSGLLGNGRINFPASSARGIRLADVVAASSCYPAGFEPMEFPGDFTWAGDVPPLGNVPVGLALMDGGIYDNEGLEALCLSDTRAARAGEPYDLLFISDTEQRTRTAHFAFGKHRIRGGPSIRFLEWTAWLGSLIAAASAIGLGVETSGQDIRDPRTWFTRLLPMAAMAFWAAAVPVGYLWVRWMMRGRFSAKVLKLWEVVRRQRAGSMMELVTLRLESLTAMATDVFMKRIRRQGLKLVYSRAEYRDRLVANFIYDLLQASEVHQKAPPDAQPTYAPSSAQVKVCEEAHAMETTLWFDSVAQDRHQLRDLVAAGHCTTCFNLLGAVEVRLTRTPENARLADLRLRLEGLWQRLKADPHALLAPRG